MDVGRYAFIGMNYIYVYTMLKGKGTCIQKVYENSCIGSLEPMEFSYHWIFSKGKHRSVMIKGKIE